MRARAVAFSGSSIDSRTSSSASRPTHLSNHDLLARAETPCSKPDTTAPSTASPRKDQPVTASEPRPKRPFEEADAEDEDGARLRRKHLIAIATSDEIRSALGDERVVNTVIRIDAAIKAEQALDAACEDPDFREFTEKVLNILAAEDETD